MTSQGENGEDRPIVRGESETETRITCPSLHPKKKKKRERDQNYLFITASKSWVTIATA